MRIKLLNLLFIALIFGYSNGQISPGQTSDFQDGTTQNWRIGGAGGSSGPINVANAGPNGSGDNALEYTSTGSGAVASRMIFFNTSAAWIGDYKDAGIIAITFDANVTTNDLDLRIAINGNGGRFCTTNAVSVAAGSGWTSVVIPAEASDFTAVGGSDINDTFNSVSAIRILSSPTPAWEGEVIAATLQVDNVVATDVLSTEEFIVDAGFTISPNPSSDKLNIKLPQSINDSSLAVYDVLGKKVYSGSINSLNTSINVSNWNSGVYLVRLTTDAETFTKRFVKQ